MPTRRLANSALALLPALILTLSCDSQTSTDPEVLGEGDAIAFTRDITVPELDSVLANGTARIEVKLVPDELVAREIGIEGSDDLNDEEEIESQITAIEGSNGSGSITMKLGDLKIDFDGSTKFRGFDGEELTEAEFADAVQAALDAQTNPDVVAKREAPAEPQAPDDATFLAKEIRLDQEVDEPEIEMNVDADNFESNSTPPPDAWIKVLGLMIEVRSGFTEIDHERDDLDKGKFEGMVASVDLDASTYTLEDGTIIRVVLGTRIKKGSLGNRRLSSLEDVAAALAEGVPVSSKGKGVLESVGPRTLVGIKIEFRVGKDVVDKFDGMVASVDLDNGTFTLDDGAVIQMADFTRIKKGDHDGHSSAYYSCDGDCNDEDDDGRRLGSLQEVADALDAGEPVRAKGTGTASDEEGISLVALTVEFKVKGDDDDDEGEFEDLVESVDLDAGTFTLKNGTVVQIDENTEIDDDEGNLTSLQEVSDALDNGEEVEAEGEGEIIGTDPKTILAEEVEFEIEDDGSSM